MGNSEEVSHFPAHTAETFLGILPGTCPDRISVYRITPETMLDGAGD
ncbi:MAG TPA: hypothetical protein VHU83_19360 [Bryobacteraceae bacterium]|nr:hypothetical protein [Bryobacteraceae bacterium]